MRPKNTSYLEVRVNTRNKYDIEPESDIKWAVTVTTAPREGCTLERCVQSIQDCGWKNIFICAEPNSTKIPNLTYIHNPQKLGVWRNWVSSVRLALSTDAEVIMTVQDDSLFHPDSKDFVESVMWPAMDCGFVSLYTPRHYSIDKNGKVRGHGLNRIYTKALWGACALVFPRHVLEEFIEHPLIENWSGAPPRSRNPEVIRKRRENPHLIGNSDTAIGKFMNWTNKSMWFVDPSAVQHIAEKSAMGHGGNTGNRNAYKPADHSIPLRDQVYNGIMA